MIADGSPLAAQTDWSKLLIGSYDVSAAPLAPIEVMVTPVVLRMPRPREARLLRGWPSALLSRRPIWVAANRDDGG